MRTNQDSSAHSRKNLFSASLLLLPLLALAGCSGSDGNTGPAGPQGPPGPPGGSGPTPTIVEQGQDAPGIHVAIVSLGGASGASGTFQVGDQVSVTFSLTKTDGTNWDISEMSYGRVLASGPSFNYQRVLPEATNVASTAVDNGDGTYTYTFASPIPAVYAAPLNDSDAFGAADGELTGQALLSGTYTLGLYFGWNYTVDETAHRDAGNATQDFLFGSATEIDAREVVKQENCNACHMSLRVHGELRRDVKLCLLCHTAGAEDRISTAAGGTPGLSIDFKVMIHKIHNGSHLPSVLGIATADNGTLDYTATPVPYQIVGYQDSISDFSDVKFPVWPNFNVAMPKDANYSTLSSTDPDGSGGPLLSPKARNDTIRTGVTACYKCHGDPDGAGPLAAPAQGNLYKTHPTEQVCYSCHDDVRPGYPYTANLQTMPDTANNTNCVLCHTASGAALSIENAHKHPLLDPNLNAGVNAVITDVSGGTGAGGNFQVGDTPTLEFTLKNDAGEDIGLSTLDSSSAFFMGPSTNQQLVMPLTSANGMSLNPFDFTGRLQAVSTSNKGTMSKVFLGATAVEETLVVEFTSTTAFSVTGSTSGSLGSGTLPAAASTNPTGGAVSNFDLGSGLTTGTVQVTFSDATHFTVSGLATGSGVLPNATNASTRFTSASLSFNIAVTTTAFAAGNTIQIGIFRGAAANPVLFAVVAGKTAFSATAGAPDRFYYELHPDAATYTLKMPMDMQLEYLGAGSGAAGQVLHPGNVPVYYGRQQLWEAATTATTTTTTSEAYTLCRQMDVVPVTGFAAGDTVVVDPAGAVGAREYVTITPLKADGTGAAAADTTTRILFRTPLRYGHDSGLTLTKVTLTLKQEGGSNAYTLTPGDSTPGSAVITSNVAFNAAAGMVLTYRTDARFGYKRHYLDLAQSNYTAPANDTVAIGAEQGDWQGLSYQDGTYEADIWFQKNLDLGLQGEVQTYRCTSNSAQGMFLYGSASEVTPHQIISNTDTCLSCHNDVLFHGGGRRGIDTCLTCHSISGNTSSMMPSTGAPIEFRQMLHKIHMGGDLPDAATYPMATEGTFPAMPGGPEQCVKCHGNNSWNAPAPREHTGASVPVRTWGTSCGSCHSSDAAQAHIAVQTSTAGYESCEVCHGASRDWSVVVMHKAH
jgi:hypothetical protein